MWVCHLPVRAFLGGFHTPCGPWFQDAHPLAGTGALAVLQANDGWQFCPPSPAPRGPGTKGEASPGGILGRLHTNPCALLMLRDPDT